MVKRISSNVSLPLSVDLESGYSRNADEIVAHIKKLNNLGVVGINIEDSIVGKSRRLLDAEKFAQLLSELVKSLKKEEVDMFVNARTDTFLLGVVNTMKETKRRIHLYENAGVYGIFVPCIEKESDIKEVANATKLPINVMCMPKLPNFMTLKTLGVQRISMGNFVFDHMCGQFKTKVEEIQTQQSFKPIF